MYTRPPEDGVVARKRPPGQTLMQRLLFILLQAEEATAVLIHDLSLEHNPPWRLDGAHAMKDIKPPTKAIVLAT